MTQDISVGSADGHRLTEYIINNGRLHGITVPCVLFFLLYRYYCRFVFLHTCSWWLNPTCNLFPTVGTYKVCKKADS